MSDYPKTYTDTDGQDIMYAGDVVREIDSLRAELAEARHWQEQIEHTHRDTLRGVQRELMRVTSERDEASRLLDEARKQKPVAYQYRLGDSGFWHTCGLSGKNAAIEYNRKHPSLPQYQLRDLYEAAPVPAQPANIPEQPHADFEWVSEICNAYESGVGHNGRPTANVNPYPPGTPQHTAYELGAKGTKHSAAAIPEGWNLAAHPDGGIVVQHRTLGGCFVTETENQPREIPGQILFYLASDMLAASKEATK